VDFENAKQEYLRLKADFEAGVMNAAQFEEAVYGLILMDSDGNLWQIGLSSGAWYRKEGDIWIEDTPSGTAVSAPAAAALPIVLPAAEAVGPRRKILNLPVWAWTLFGLGGLVTLLGIFTVLTYYFINQRPTPIAVAPTMAVFETRTPTPTHTIVRRTLALGVETAVPEDTPSPVETEVVEELTPTMAVVTTATSTTRPNTNANLLPTFTWKLISWTNFDRLENIRGEWRATMDDSVEYELGEYEFLSYKGLNGTQFRSINEYTDVMMQSSEEELNLTDVEIEEVMAFKPGSTSEYMDIMCRFEEWIFTYSFTVSSNDWKLIKYNDDEEVDLASGQMPSGFRSGEWGRVRMRCVGDTISVWLNSRLLASVRDTTFPSGQWAMTLYLNEGSSEASVYLQSHRVYQQKNEVPLLGDMVQVGDTFITLDSGWRREGARNSLGVWFENRTNQELKIEADQVYLLRPDGRQIAVDPNPSEGNAYRFPLSVKENLRAEDLYFIGLTADDIDWGLQLVVDLTSAGYNEVRFQLPVE
jgi:hypothetical protein